MSIQKCPGGHIHLDRFLEYYQVQLFSHIRLDSFIHLQTDIRSFCCFAYTQNLSLHSLFNPIHAASASFRGTKEPSRHLFPRDLVILEFVHWTCSSLIVENMCPSFLNNIYIYQGLQCHLTKAIKSVSTHQQTRHTQLGQMWIVDLFLCTVS